MKTNQLALAAVAVLFLGTTSALAQFPPVLDLSTLDGANGLVINGASADDFSGLSVSDAGDINGDGLADLIIGAHAADANGNNRSGRSYVVFGSKNGLPNPFELSAIDGDNGFVINGVNANDRSGFSVSGAGDINGDGLADLIIGAHFANSNGNTGSGSSYVVFGSDQGFPNPFELSAIDGANGFVINGVNANDRSGRSVSGIGDINGDGLTDLIIGAYLANANGVNSGSTYVLFGSDQGLPNPFNLSAINGSNGFVIDGVSGFTASGFSVSGAGDINGDGLADLIISAYRDRANGNSFSGSVYVVFGSDQGLPNPLDLSAIDGANGFVINGINAFDYLGASVSGAGDINGDGLADLIISAHAADPNGNSNSGSTYVVFGNDQGLPNPLDLSAIDGANGFVINGVNALDYSGKSVSSAGDINGDGLADLIIGAPAADPNGNTRSGSTYVVFGSDQGLPNPFELSTINGSNGFVINGVNAFDRSGRSVSGAGDINGDGLADLIIGASNADPNGNSDSGSAYVVFGSNGNSDAIFINGFE